MAQFEVLNKEERIPMMGAPQGIEQMQNNGYKNSANAISELIDNSIQADAKNIDIIIIYKHESGFDRIKNIVVADDGIGMDFDTFKHSTQLQGGTKYGNKDGLGRYGMGLPSSSISQTSFFEVYSWQKSGDKEKLYAYLDLNENVKNNNAFLNPISKVTVEGFGNKLLDKCCNHILDNNSGTLVHWKEPNRLTWKTLNKFNEKVTNSIGRKFRYYINENKVRIRLIVFENNGSTLSEKRDYKKSIKAFDPMFLMKNTKTAEAKYAKNFDGITSVKFAEEVVKEYHERIEKDGKEYVLKHKVRLKFSHVKEEVRIFIAQSGETPGGTPLGNLYKFRNHSNKLYPIVSILRANREIDSGNFGLIRTSTGGSVNEMDRWVSAEIHIDTAITDRIFDIDQKKQNAKLYNIDKKDASTYKEQIHSDIYRLINENIKSMNKAVRDQLTKTKKKKNVGDSGKAGEIMTPIPPSDGGVDSFLTATDKTNITEWLLSAYSEYSGEGGKEKINNFIKLIEEYKSRDFIFHRNLPDGILYNANLAGEKNIIEINSNHPFYINFMQPVYDEKNEQASTILRLLFCALVRAEQSSSQDEKILRRIRTNFSMNLEDLIEGFLEN